MNEDNKIEISSDFRVPFEPKEEKLKQLREQIRNQISGLKNYTEFNHLEACFITQKKESYDVENILFYNIGTGIFNKLHLDEISFKLSINSELGTRCIYNYSNSDKLESETKVDEILEFDFELNKLNTSSKPFYCFQERKKGKTKNHKEYENQYFGLNIKVSTPKRITNIASIIKPLLDGIISSFHSYEKIESSLVDIIAKKHRLPNSEIKKLFERDERDKSTFLDDGRERKLVRKHGKNGYALNPSDDKCVEVNIKQEVIPELLKVQISGVAYNTSFPSF